MVWLHGNFSNSLLCLQIKAPGREVPPPLNQRNKRGGLGSDGAKIALRSSRLRGRQSISCKPLCVRRVFGSYFKFRQKRAERLPGKHCSTGTDLALCLCLHKNSLQLCWMEVGPISCSDKARCLWQGSINAPFSSLSIPYTPSGMRGDSSVWRVGLDDSGR